MSAHSIRVCVLISSFRPLIGGAERATERLCQELIRQCVDVVVLTRHHRGLSRRDQVGQLPVLRLGLAGSGKIGALVYALHALWLLSTSLRVYSLVHVQNPDTPLLVGFLAKLLLRRSLVVTIQSDPAVVFGPQRVTGRERLKLLGRLADAVGAQNCEMRLQLVKSDVPETLVSILPNSVDTGYFYPPTEAERQSARELLGLGKDPVAFLFVGRLIEDKGVDKLLAAWQRLPKAENRVLLIVGDGPERERLKSLASKLDLSGIRFEPATDNVLTYLQAADVFVLPSRREGLSSALLEAMSVGLGVIVSDLSANLAVIQDGYNGLTFSVENEDALASHMLQMESAEIRSTLGGAARDTAASYSIQRVATTHRKLYARLIASEKLA